MQCLRPVAGCRLAVPLLLRPRQHPLEPFHQAGFGSGCPGSRLCLRKGRGLGGKRGLAPFFSARLPAKAWIHSRRWPPRASAPIRCRSSPESRFSGWRDRWDCLHAQHLVGVAAHLGDLVGAHAVLLHQPARGVGAVGREVPVAVAGVARIRRGVGVALDQQRIGQRLQLRGQQRQQLLAAGAQLRASDLVEGSVLALDQLDAQPLGGDGDLNLLGELLQIFAAP